MHTIRYLEYVPHSDARKLVLLLLLLIVFELSLFAAADGEVYMYERKHPFLCVAASGWRQHNVHIAKVGHWLVESLLKGRSLCSLANVLIKLPRDCRAIQTKEGTYIRKPHYL